ncbi:MAG: efflux RND transporter periplasmic adaptor subunit [Spirochaetia bacterium]|jgi:multidrug efflux pump subunit AcrA (membrane-fusion protein)|nr:efflux RND transporter periplasmic adaptor subunit [Spirochaetia bacterium]
MNKKTKIRIAVIASVIIVLLASIAVFNRIGQERKADKKNQAAATDAVFTVETSIAGRRDITDYIRINGDVEAVRSIDIYPDTAGKLSKLYISIGSYVKNGQAIAEIDPSKPGLSFALSPVRSTINGTVTSIPYEAGATVSPSTPVATIGDLSMLQVEAEIAEPYIAKVEMGTKGEVSFAAWPEKKYEAHIVEISPVVNKRTRTMGIKLEFDKNYPEIKAGMFASLKLFTETRKNVIFVSSETIVTRGGDKSVFTVSEGKAVMKRVVTGITVDGLTEVISGIAEGEEIVTRGQNLLDDGVDVIIPGRRN